MSLSKLLMRESYNDEQQVRLEIDRSSVLLNVKSSFLQ